MAITGNVLFENMATAHSFRNLDQALKKGKLTLSMSSSYEADHFMRHGRTVETIQMYQLGNGVTIAREGYVERGSEDVRVTGFPQCDYAERPYSDSSTFYFVLSKGMPVTDVEKAKTLIRQATGVKLHRIDTPKDERPSLPFALPLFDGYNNLVVTDFRVGKEPEMLDYRDGQPTEKDMVIQLRDFIKDIDSLKERFGMDITNERAKELRLLAYGFYQKYKRKLSNHERKLFEKLVELQTFEDFMFP